MIYLINTAFLNLRSEPRLGRNIITALPKGHKVDSNESSNTQNNWWYVSTTYKAIPLEGYVSSQYLIPESEETQPTANPTKKLIAAHRKEDHPNARRNTREEGWSYPLGEPNRPGRDLSSKTHKVNSLHNIIEWLNVEQSERYQKNGNSTYCNIYAHDYCYLAGTYIPRVWWTPKALMAIASGEKIIPTYGQTILEMNANGLYDWIVDFGEHFGWKQIFSLENIQNAANDGSVGIIMGKNKNLNKSGHICAVVPESGRNKATRTNVVTSPLISQAGSSNYAYKTGYNWWQFPKFSHFGFWVHK